VNPLKMNGPLFTLTRTRFLPKNIETSDTYKRTRAGGHNLASGRGSGPDHYEILGLPQTASSDELTRAYVREMSSLKPRPLAALTQLSVAYETLRDPDRRRAYDSTLHPPAAPKPHYSVQWTPAPIAAPVLAFASTRIENDEASDVRFKSDRQPHARISGEGQGPPFFAKEVREPASSVEDAEPTAFAQFQRREPPAGLAPQKREAAPEEWLQFQPDRARESSIDWKRTAMAIAWPVLGVAMLGAVIGWAANMVEEPQQPAPPVKMALPPPAPSLAMSDTPEISTNRNDEEKQVELRRQSDRLRIAQTRLPKTTAAPEQPVAPSSSGEEQIASNSIEPATETPSSSFSSSADAAVTSMPLSDRTIARTISRIGYSCGRVASIAPVPGQASGVFTVTCSSGQSYRATPVGGRYRFRRSSGE
jgi:hypothetical protein